MNQENETGFFRQYFTACFQPGKYKTLLEKKTGGHVLYMILLLIFLLVIDTIIPFGAWMTSMGGFRGLFLERIPAFTVENGIFTSESPVSFNIGPVLRVEMDSGVEKFTEADVDKDYQEEILVSRTNVLIRSMDTMTEIPLSGIADMKLSNQTLVAAIPFLVVMIVIYMLMTLASKAVQYLLMALILGVVCRFGVISPEGKRVSIKEAFLIAMYARTLFAVIESVNSCLGYVIPAFWVTAISVMVVMGYIFRAEVSILKPEQFGKER